MPRRGRINLATIPGYYFTYIGGATDRDALSLYWVAAGLDSELEGSKLTNLKENQNWPGEK